MKKVLSLLVLLGAMGTTGLFSDCPCPCVEEDTTKQIEEVVATEVVGLTKAPELVEVSEEEEVTVKAVVAE